MVVSCKNKSDQFPFHCSKAMQDRKSGCIPWSRTTEQGFPRQSITSVKLLPSTRSHMTIKCQSCKQCVTGRKFHSFPICRFSCFRSYRSIQYIIYTLISVDLFNLSHITALCTTELNKSQETGSQHSLEITAGTQTLRFLLDIVNGVDAFEKSYWLLNWRKLLIHLFTPDGYDRI